MGKYTLEVNGTPFDDLNEFKDVGEVPPVGHSTQENIYGANTQLIVFLVFLEGRRTPVSIEHNMRSGFVTIELRGKPEMSWQVKNFRDAFKYPYNFVYEDHKFTLRVQVDEEGDETDNLELEIDGLIFTKHPFVSSDFSKFIFHCQTIS